jgi:hypothetical protein
MSGTAPSYTQAFSPLPDRCFRPVASQGEAGPTHCPEPVAWRGSWRAPNGRRHLVEACEATGRRQCNLQGHLGNDRLGATIRQVNHGQHPVAY